VLRRVFDADLSSSTLSAGSLEVSVKIDATASYSPNHQGDQTRSS